MQVYLTFIDEISELIIRSCKETKHKFAVEICQKLFPYYKEFTKNSSNVLSLQQAIDFAEKSANETQVDKQKLDELIDTIDKITPNSTELISWDESYAINAAEAVLEHLYFIKDQDNKHIIQICSLMIDTIDFKIAEDNEDINDDEIYEHPLMVETMDAIKAAFKEK